MAHQGENPQDQRIHRRLGGKLFQRFIGDKKIFDLDDKKLELCLKFR